MNRLKVARTQKFSVIATNTERGVEVSSDLTVAARQTKLGIFLDVNEPYTRRLIKEALSDPSRSIYFDVTLGPGDSDLMDPIPLPSHCSFQWAEYERIDWTAVLAGRHGASSYCIRKGLSRKAQLAYYTHRHVCKHPTSLLKDAIPETVILDTWPVWEHGGDGTSSCGPRSGLADVIVSMGSMTAGGGAILNRRERLDLCLSEAKRAMEQAERAYELANNQTKPQAPVWILKGSTVNKGVGIHIVHLYEQVVDICWTESDIREWVLQRYISSPLLLRKRKFHIRAYAVAVDALRVYLCQDCLALCAGTQYHKGDTTNLFAHITNTAFQDLDPNFCEKDCVLMWSEEEIAPLIAAGGTCQKSEAEEKVRQSIDDMGKIVAELFQAYQTEFGVFSPIVGCFEHYGLDFVIEVVGNDWHTRLLEVNPGPDFKQTGSRLQPAIRKLMGSTVDVAFLRRGGCVGSVVGNLKLVFECQMRPGSNTSINMKLS